MEVVGVKPTSGRRCWVK